MSSVSGLSDFADLGYQPEGIPITNLQPPPEWRLPNEPGQEDAQEDEEDGDHAPPI